MTILYDNNPSRDGLRTDWGFACLIEGPDKTVLFDTGGNGEILCENLRTLGLSEMRIDAVVLSHIHGDHTGGLPAIMRERPGVKVYVPTGFPEEYLERVRGLGCEPVVADESVTLFPGCRTTGTLGQGRIEEHALCVRTTKGWVLITGCAHPGVHKLAARAREVVGDKLHLVFGGFHMARHRDSVIRNIITRLEDLGVQRACPCHCSGDRTRELFKEQMGDRCRLVGVGDVFEF
jgi:7,8-dihydropterin-6-yl-methyl-4-(beta-D-ribofuranosyl)aminobenzene 5'-phosphate synthase